MNGVSVRILLLLVQLLIFTASWQEVPVANAAPFPKFAFNLRKNSVLSASYAPSRASSSAAQTKMAQNSISKQHRGGATAAAVKTMTARQMEAFK